MMKPTDLAWVAGIVDGEGCIHISRRRATAHSDIRTDNFRLYIKVTMGDLPTIKRIRNILDLGTIHDHASRGPHISASYSWMAGARVAEKSIKLIYPYLVTKKPEADLAFEFFGRPTGLTGGANGNERLSHPELLARLSLYWRLRMAKPRWRFYRQELSKEDRSELRRLGLSK